MAGYSGTPLVKKLGLRPGRTLYTKSAPPDYFDLVSPLPDGLTIARRLRGTFDVIHLFVRSHAELRRDLPIMLDHLASNGMLWVSWPKRASKSLTDVTEDTIRAVALSLGLVDVKVCAVDDVWSGLKLMIRREKR